MIFPPGATSKSLDVQIVDDSGLPVTGLVAATFPPVYWSLAGNTASTEITLSDLAAITTGYTSGGVKERVGSAGIYRLDLPDAALTTAGAVKVYGEATGKHLICEAVTVMAAPLDAAGTRSALGLAAANLDTQLGDLPTNAEFEARTLASAAYATAANQTTILSKTNLIPASPAEVGSAMTLAAGAITEATITTPAETAGPPTGILGMIRRLWEGRHGNRNRNRTTGVVTIRNAANDADLESATQSSTTVGSDTVDSISRGT